MGNLMAETWGKMMRVEQRETSPELEELRSKRNKLQDEVYQIQNKIDHIILDMHKVPDMVGKWVKITNSKGAYIGIVNNVERLFWAFRVEFKEAFVETHKMLAANKNFSMDFDWEDAGQTVILDQDEALKIVRDRFEEVLNKYNGNN